jgi:uncharacterized repeat protein (TIGR01451 family)
MARAGDETLVRVLVVVEASARIDLSTYGRVLTDAELSHLGLRHVTLEIPADRLAKLASLPGVVAIADTGPRPAPEPPDLGEPGSGPETYATPPRYGVDHFFENEPTGVYQTWSLGFTGEGDPADPVKVAIIDSGVDFANVALRGRWAVQPAGGAYAGWPIAFDDRSMSEWAADPHRAWAAGGAGNWGWYANTAYTLTATGFPLVDPSGHPVTYTRPPVTSTSGVYHFGYHPDPYWTSSWPGAHGFPVGLVVVDAVAPGVYDTVCVDLDADGAFETCMDQYAPAGPGAYGPVGGLDQTGDGEWDLSAGLVYWIDDGTNPPPAAGWLYGSGPSPHGPGSLVAFMLGSYSTYGGGHGTWCASAAAGYDGISGTGVLDDKGQLNPFVWTPGTPIVAGPGSGGTDAVAASPGAGLAGGADVIAMGNVYAGGSSLNHYLFTQFGYDGTPGTGDEAQIVSMSFDDGGVDADAWDFPSRYLTWLNLTYGGPVYVSSTGNGGPGYGTANTPGPATRVAVGASTQYGPYDTYGTYEGIRNGRGTPNWWDVEPWSNRGPSAMSTLAPDVVCNGSSSSGATALNGLRNGVRAWTLWGGTSRSTPVCAGMLALVYDAYHAAHGRYPTWREARSLLMNGAADLGYDEQVAGAGAGYALRSALIAGGEYGVTVDPPRYEAGTAHAGPRERYESFAHGLYPGQSDVMTFTLRNPGTVSTTVTLEDEWLRQVGRQTITVPTRMATVVTTTNWNLGAPDYAVDLTPLIEDHAAADLMVVRVTYPFEQFAADPEDAASLNQAHRTLVYNWWDDGDGVWWDDSRGVITGRVEMSPTTGLTHELDLDDDWLRFASSSLWGTTQEVRVHHPAQRMGSGAWLGLSPVLIDTPTDTVYHVDVIFYQHQDWDRIAVEPVGPVDIPPGGETVVTVTVSAAPGDPYGETTGRLVVSDTGRLDVDPLYAPHRIVVPIARQVWFTATVDPVVGGTSWAGTPYDNGYVYGAFTWSGRQEAGDWRIYPFVLDDAPAGSRVLVHTTWEDYPTDIDTVLLGPTEDAFSPGGSLYPGDESWFGPYTEAVIGGSPRVGNRPRWAFDTATGTTEDWVSAPAGEGLHELLLHTVLYGGETTAVPFTASVGLVSMTPYSVVLNGLTCVSCTVPVRFKSGMALPEGLALGGAFGWFRPVVLTDTIAQSQLWVRPLVLTDSYRLEIATAEVSGAPDIDLYLVRDHDGDGSWGSGDELVASSGSAGSDEVIEATNLPDGDYLILVYGFTVTGTPGVFHLTYRDVAGAGVVSVNGLPGAIAAGKVYTLSLRIDEPPQPGAWEGLVLLGPPVAPTALELPVTIYQAQARKTARPDVVGVGERITYSIAITAPAEAPLTRYVVEDPVPAGTRVVAVDGAVYSPTLDGVWWAGWLGAGGAATHDITITTQVTAPVPDLDVENTAWVRTDGQSCPLVDSVALELPEWSRFVDSAPWREGISVTAEVSDTIAVVDVITSRQPFTLSGSWDALHLTLVGIDVTAGQVVTAAGRLGWGVASPASTPVTLTRWFRVEPCTWTETWLGGILLVEEEFPVAERPVDVSKVLPELAIAAAYSPLPLYDGMTATFTLSYSNTGGYEPEVTIRGQFPITVPFLSASPVPTETVADGTGAVWVLGGLGGGDADRITVTVVVSMVRPVSQRVIASLGIYDHAEKLEDAVALAFDVRPRRFYLPVVVRE